MYCIDFTHIHRLNNVQTASYFTCCTQSPHLLLLPHLLRHIINPGEPHSREHSCHVHFHRSSRISTRFRGALTPENILITTTELFRYIPLPDAPKEKDVISILTLVDFTDINRARETTSAPWPRLVGSPNAPPAKSRSVGFAGESGGS